MATENTFWGNILNNPEDDSSEDNLSEDNLSEDDSYQDNLASANLSDNDSSSEDNLSDLDGKQKENNLSPLSIASENNIIDSLVIDDQKIEAQISIVLLGSRSSGKTTLFSKLVNEDIPENENYTKFKQLKKNKIMYSLQEVPPGDKMHHFNRSQMCLKNADLKIICFDLNCRNLAEMIEGWVQESLKYPRSNSMPIIVVATKKDLQKTESFTYEMRKSLVKNLETKYNCSISYVECSAKTGVGMDILNQEIDRLSQLFIKNQLAIKEQPKTEKNTVRLEYALRR